MGRCVRRLEARQRRAPRQTCGAATLRTPQALASGGGVWMADAAPAVDNGDIYVVTGKQPLQSTGRPRPTWRERRAAHLEPRRSGSLVTNDWFTPFLDVDRDGSHKDQDLAAGGILALPDEAGLIAGGTRTASTIMSVARSWADATSANCSMLRLSRRSTISPGTATSCSGTWIKIHHRPMHDRPRRPRPDAAHPWDRRLLQ